MQLVYSKAARKLCVVSSVSTVSTACCRICESRDRQLVRDHNHKTGLIRGLLCDRCNSWVGVYESKRPTFQNQKQRAWFKKYEPRILAHLASNTGVLYRGT